MPELSEEEWEVGYRVSGGSKPALEDRSSRVGKGEPSLQQATVNTCRSGIPAAIAAGHMGENQDLSKQSNRGSGLIRGEKNRKKGAMESSQAVAGSAGTIRTICRNA